MIILSILLLSNFLHDFHSTIMEVEYIKESNKLEVSYQVFVDDLERQLSGEGVPDHSITKEQLETDQKLKGSIYDFVVSTVKIQGSDQLAEFVFLGCELRDHEVWIFFETLPFQQEQKSIQVDVNSFNDMFDDQLHHVHFKCGDDRSSAKLSGSSTAARFQI